MRKIQVALAKVESFSRSVSSLVEENERTRSSIDDASRQVLSEIDILLKGYDEELAKVHEDMAKAKNLLSKLQSELQKTSSSLASTPKTVTSQSSDGKRVTSSNPAYESLAQAQSVAASKVQKASSIVSSFNRLEKSLNDERRNFEMIGRQIEEGTENVLKCLEKERTMSNQVQDNLAKIVDVINRYETESV